MLVLVFMFIDVGLHLIMCYLILGEETKLKAAFIRLITIHTPGYLMDDYNARDDALGWLLSQRCWLKVILERN